MLYLVSAELHDPKQMSAGHEEFQELIRKVFVPSLHELVQLQTQGKVRGGGIRAVSQGIVFILDLPEVDSHLAVRRLLFTFPMFSLYRWEITPLESFQELLAVING